jgi:3-phenylpropionate/trans-cinnamate dioxygenase ferredoxin subunit
MPEWITVATTDALPEGEMVAHSMDGQDVLVVNVAGRYLAIGAVCTHEGGPLEEGVIEEGTVMCPWHGSMFDLETGEAVGPPATEDVPVYQVRVEGDAIQVARPGG